MKGKVTAIIFIALGLATLVFANKITYFGKEEYKKFIETTATVIEIEECEITDEDGTTSGGRNVLEYEVNDRKYQVTEMSCSTFDKSIGKTLKVKYNPRNPKDAIIPSDAKNTAILLYILGGSFIIAGIVKLFKRY
jgi:hypothetical protein